MDMASDTATLTPLDVTFGLSQPRTFSVAQMGGPDQRGFETSLNPAPRIAGWRRVVAFDLTKVSSQNPPGERQISDKC